MSNLLRLTKINLMTFFNIYKIKSAKDSKELVKAVFKLLLALLVVGYLGFYIYTIAHLTMAGYVQLNIEHIILVQFMALTSTLILFTNIFKVNGLLFKFKDYDLLMSLPIKKSAIIASKIIMLYITNLVYVLLIMIPIMIVYVKEVSVDFLFYLLYFITIFILPLVPIILATIIGTILTSISSRFKKKNFASIMITLLYVIFFMYLSYELQNDNAVDLANIGNSMVKIFNKIYPLTGIYLSIVKDYNIISLLEFIVIPIVLFVLFIVVINKYYLRINDNLISTYTNSNYKYKKKSGNSPLKALYIKELKRYFSSANYVLNTAMGSILLCLSVICLVIFGNEKLELMLGMPGIADKLKTMGPILLGAFCALNCSTHSSISLEGKNLWIIKSIPISAMTIFISKILVNLTILVPTIILSSTILSIYLKLSFLNYLLMLLTPLMYAVFISLLGIVLNLSFPNFDWKNEIRVIKQSIPSFGAILIGIIVAIVPLNINVDLPDNLYILLITSIVFILNIGMFSYLKLKGDNILKSL